MATLNNSYIPESRSDQTLLLLSKVKTLKKQKLITLIGFSRSFRLLLLPSPHRFAQEFFDQKKISSFVTKKLLLARSSCLTGMNFFSSLPFESIVVGFHFCHRRSRCRRPDGLSVAETPSKLWKQLCEKISRRATISIFFPSWFWERILTLSMR